MKNIVILIISILILILIKNIIPNHSDHLLADTVSKVGDINGDGKVSSLDYVLIRNHMLGKSLLKGDKLTKADIDSNKKLDAIDYIAIRKIILDGSVVISLKLNKKNLTLEIGKSVTLVKTLVASDPNTKLTWTSSNTKVATVNKNGKVTAKSVGTATITVTTEDKKKSE